MGSLCSNKIPKKDKLALFKSFGGSKEAFRPFVLVNEKKIREGPREKPGHLHLQLTCSPHQTLTRNLFNCKTFLNRKDTPGVGTERRHGSPLHPTFRCGSARPPGGHHSPSAAYRTLGMNGVRPYKRKQMREMEAAKQKRCQDADNPAMFFFDAFKRAAPS